MLNVDSGNITSIARIYITRKMEEKIIHEMNSNMRRSVVENRNN